MKDLGHLLRIGDTVSLAEGVVAEMLAISRRRVQRVRVRLLPPPPSSVTSA